MAIRLEGITKGSLCDQGARKLPALQMNRDCHSDEIFFLTGGAEMIRGELGHETGISLNA